MTVSTKPMRTRPRAFQDRATVVDVDGRAVVVHHERGRVRARLAASCLMRPDPGDEVLLARLDSGELYVLAVLERAAPARLVVDGDLTVQVSQGELTIAARDGVNVVSANDIQLTTTKRLGLRAAQGELFVDELAYLGRKLVANVAHARSVFGAVDTAADRIVQRAKRAYRFVEELDQLRTAYLDYTAKENARIRAHNALVSAEQLFKVDAEQIHLG